MATDDDIIRRKLLIEGDGTGSDTRINTFLKTFYRWAASPANDEESNATYQRLLSMLAQIEHAYAKTKFIYDMNIEEKAAYERLYKDIGNMIEETQQKIVDCKNELQQAKRIRKNKQEYDVLAKLIQQHPDRQETMKELEVLEKELKDFKREKQALEDKFELRRKEFHVLMVSICELTRLLEADEERTDEQDVIIMDVS